MQRSLIFVVLTLGLLGIALTLWFLPYTKIFIIYHAPISFWGKVIDQDKRPVEGANIHYEAIDHYFGPSTAYAGFSDQNGLFSITGIGGAGLYVRVSKDGYYLLGEKSMRGFHTGSSDMPSQDNPAIFELRKRGQTEYIIMIQRYVKIPRCGVSIGCSHLGAAWRQEV